jgi:alpha-ribazole phosphatase
MTTRIDLLRHGKVAGPPALYGRTDVAVSSDGEQQLWRAVQSVSPEQVITSPLQRCRVFAEAFARRQQLPCRIEADLQEVDFGRWDGVPFDDLYAEPEEWQRIEAYWQAPGVHAPPEGESLVQAHQRVGLCWQHLQQQLQGKHSLVVCHGGVIRLLLAHVIPADWRDGRWFSALDIGYASLTRIEISDMPDAVPVVRFIGLPVMER